MKHKHIYSSYFSFGKYDVPTGWCDCDFCIDDDLYIKILIALIDYCNPFTNQKEIDLLDKELIGIENKIGRDNYNELKYKSLENRELYLSYVKGIDKN
jgi:hypothetical protein